MTNDSLMKVESIAECSPWSILQYYWRPTVLKNNFLSFWEWPFFTQTLLYMYDTLKADKSAASFHSPNTVYFERYIAQLA